MKKIIAGFIIAFAFWFLMFSPWTAEFFNFWYTMLVATGVLTLYSLYFGKDDLKRIYKFEFRWLYIGLIAAVLLYGLFYLGNEISQLIFDFTRNQVENIYSTKSQADKWFIGLALLLWIGPAEEIFWRGYAQEKLSQKFGYTWGFWITTLIYALVHIWAFNFILFMAALICGMFWGWMYMKYKNIWPGIISHAVWDVFIFVIIPITN